MAYARFAIVTTLIALTGCPPPAASTTDTDPSTSTSTSEGSSTAPTTTVDVPTTGESTTTEGTTTDGITPTEGTTTEGTTTEGTTTEGTTTTTEGTTTEGTTTEGTTTADTTTTSGSSSTTVGDTDTDTETTGAPSPVGPARVYYTASVGPGLPDSLRVIEVADGVASAPATVIDLGPDVSSLMTTVATGEQTLALHAELLGGAKLWFVDTATADVSELDLPPAISAVEWMNFSPDGSRMLLSAGTESKRDLYLCAVGPGACTPGLMNPPFGPTGTMEPYAPLEMSSGNTWLAYSADKNGDGGLDILVGRADTPGQATTVLSFLSKSMTLRVAAFTPDEQFLYVGLADSQLDRVDFFAVDLSQQPLQAVSIDLPMEKQPTGQLAPDLHAILMWNGQGSSGDLYIVPLDGTSAGTPVWLNAAGPGRAKDRDFQWSPDGSRVAFVADHEQVGTDALYLVDGEGLEAPIKASAPLGAGATIEQIEFAPDSQRVAFFAAEQDGGPELFMADLTGTATKLSLPLPPLGGLSMYRWSRDSARVLYLGGQEAANIEDLFVAQGLDGVPTPAAKVNAQLQPGGMVLPWFQFASDGQRAFYQAGPDYNSGPLFMAALLDDGPEQPVQISAPGEEVWVLHVVPPAP